VSRHELIVPDPATEVIPRGWSKELLAQADEIENLALLDAGRASLRGHIAAWMAKGHDAKELQAAERYVEVRIGELLGPGEMGRPTESSVDTELLDKNQRHEFRRMAWFGKKPIRGLAIQAIENGKLSRGAVLRYIDEKTAKPTNGSDPIEIRYGDFRDELADIEPDSIDLILTDPPYPAEFLPLWSALAEFAAEKLKPGGSLLAYSGQGNLPEVIARLSQHMRYWWTLSLNHGHGSQNLPGKFVTIGWKPILWFVKENRRDRGYVADRLGGSSPRKTSHAWGQGRDELEPLIRSLTAPDDLIVDPFAGSGTVGLAAVALGRRFIGAEVNE
jgi:16S rRNA G966 N2-methylase RsmD